MKVIYMSHRYHTNQTTIMKGWKENGHEVRFLSQYAGKIEDYKYIKPIVVGYSLPFRIFDYIYIHFLKRKDPALTICHSFTEMFNHTFLTICHSKKRIFPCFTYILPYKKSPDWVIWAFSAAPARVCP